MLISVQLDVDYFRDALLACTKRRTQHISYLYVQTIFMFKIEGLMKQMDFFWVLLLHVESHTLINVLLFQVTSPPLNIRFILIFLNLEKELKSLSLSANSFNVVLDIRFTIHVWHSQTYRYIFLLLIQPMHSCTRAFAVVFLAMGDFHFSVILKRWQNKWDVIG